MKLQVGGGGMTEEKKLDGITKGSVGGPASKHLDKMLGIFETSIRVVIEFRR